MRKLLELFCKWIQQLKDRKGKFLVVYLDRDNETQHRFKFADESRAKNAYEFLKKILTKTQAPNMMVELFNEKQLVLHYDTFPNVGLRTIDYVSDQHQE